MSDYTEYELAKSIMGNHFIGPIELESMDMLRFVVSDIPPIEYSQKELEEKSGDYYLILGISSLADGRKITIRTMINIFGKDPSACEPCFYNQDWYEKELFLDTPMKDEWFFVKKKIFEDSRAKNPEDLIPIYSFPNAISCVYSFFVVWLIKNDKLWEHDYVWCSDKDHNGDRIYVGKYSDIDGMNKNGFSIHRHLSIKSYYGSI